MYIDRVNDMISFLEHIREQMRLDKLNKNKPVIGFDLDTWANPSNRNYCGTTACAVGHAALDPRFQENGLSMVLNYKDEHRNGTTYNHEWKSKPINNVDDIKSTNKIILNDAGSTWFFSIRYTDPVTKLIYTEFSGIDRFFDFEYYETSYILFAADRYPSNNKSIRNVIARLKYLVKNGEDALGDNYT